MVSTNIKKDFSDYEWLFNAIDEFTVTTGYYPNYLVMSKNTFFGMYKEYGHGIMYFQNTASGEHLINGFPVAFNEALETGRIDVV